MVVHHARRHRTSYLTLVSPLAQRKDAQVRNIVIAVFLSRHGCLCPRYKLLACDSVFIVISFSGAPLIVFNEILWQEVVSLNRGDKKKRRNTLERQMNGRMTNELAFSPSSVQLDPLVLQSRIRRSCTIVSPPLSPDWFSACHTARRKSPSSLLWPPFPSFSHSSSSYASSLYAF